MAHEPFSGRSPDSATAHRNPLGREAFPFAGYPPPEPVAPRRWTRFVALAAMAIGAAYLVWRAGFTVAWDAWWVSVPLLLLEVHAYISLLLFVPVTWDLDAIPPCRRVTTPELRVAILIPTYNESADILLPTIAAALVVRLPHETWVLDDGDRPEIWDLAQRLGANYLSRKEHTHAKAGNINHALPLLDVDFLVILDADHVAEPGLLEKTLGYFDDPEVALVQTPQDFYNLGSFEYFGEHNEQNVFYRVLQPARNRWNAAFWCGTGGIVRLSALRQVGGLATELITEDIHTTIRLHRAGWKTVYHNEPLARGLAASSADQYLSQRYRWGTGAMQVLQVDDPFFGPGLTLMQRICYAGTLFGWFISWRTVGYILLPLAVIATGSNPLSAPLLVLLPAFLVQMAVQQYALHRLSRGMSTPFWSIIFDFSRLPATFAATFQRFFKKRRHSRLPRKGLPPRAGGARAGAWPAVLAGSRQRCRPRLGPGEPAAARCAVHLRPQGRRLGRDVLGHFQRAVPGHRGAPHRLQALRNGVARDRAPRSVCARSLERAGCAGGQPVGVGRATYPAGPRCRRSDRHREECDRERG